MSLSTKSKWIVSTVIALGLTGAASATDRTFDGGPSGTGTAWNVAANWSGDTMPVDGDKAIIPNGFICHVNLVNARADAFEVQSGGTLIIDAGKLLEIDSNSTVATAQGVQLAGSGSELKISGSLTISGAGSVEGQHEDALIRVTSSFTLTNTATIEGTLEILGTGMFDNEGTVDANADGMLDVNPGALAVDHVNAEWRCSDEDALLVFRVGNTSMLGDFYLVNGVMWFTAAMETSGVLDQDDGEVDIDADFTVNEYIFDGGIGSVGAGYIFEFMSFSTSSSKSNPDNQDDGSNDPPYEVDNTGTLIDYTWS